MRNVAAAFVFFTRLPFWRLKCFNVDAQYYKQVINYWAIVGWFTSLIMVGSLWCAAQILPYSVAIIIAILSRILMTGALHEDGLADFFDGFGGGTSKSRILEIMKDSHIGTYGVISLIFYFLLFYILLSCLPLNIACFTIVAADPLCKSISSLITLFLPYARTEETSKSKVVYDKMTAARFVMSLIFGLAPMLFVLDAIYWLAIILPLVTFSVLMIIMKKKIQGYTGDCCGATFLMTELSFIIGVVIIFNHYQTTFFN